MTDQFQRPLSPHLQIFRLMFTMLMSIVHRITGMALYFGSILLVWWLTAAAMGPDYFNFVQDIFGSWPGLFVLIGLSWALLHHFLGGIRHLVWDTGHGLKLPTVELLARLTLAGSILLTIGLWALAYMQKG
jgi:succinate dehydrogenase / fumarate reductase, cytochrome b subunit